MTRFSGIPDGFSVVRSVRPPAGTLIAAETLLDPLSELGLDSPDGWTRQMVAAGGGPGRGATGGLELAGESLVLKQMRRGGTLAAVWSNRYLGRSRLLDNLLVPLAVARRGIATAEPVALLLVPGPPGLYRGWLATRRIEGAEDLMRRFASGKPPGPSQLGAVMALIRSMHDAGIEHPDLNLGNLMVRDGPSESEAFVIDLDRVRLGDDPLSFARRQRAIRRLERSFMKSFGSAEAPDWFALYAANDSALVERLERGRPIGRLLQRLHRLGRGA